MKDCVSLTGTDCVSLTGTDCLSLTGTDCVSLTGTDRISLTGTDRISLTGTGFVGWFVGGPCCTLIGLAQGGGAVVRTLVAVLRTLCQIQQTKYIITSLCHT